MKRERLYWLCQAAGWTFYALANVVIFAFIRPDSWAQIVSPFWVCAIGFAETHFLRLFINTRGWKLLPTADLLPRMAISSVVLTAVWESLFLVTIWLTTDWKLPLGTILGMSFGLGTTLLIWQLFYFGFHYVENYKKSEIERWRLESAVKEAQLAALKSQMNPHFIFNCLNNIRGLISEDPKRAQTVVTQLANILRYSLQTGSGETVPLAEELQIVSDYLALEAVRLEERLKVKMDIDPSSLNVSIPAMLVQTLVENGIKYGVERLPKGGEITLKSRVENGATLKIQITNTGQLSGTDNASTANGVGLKNSAERINLLFGDAASLTLENSSADTVAAKLAIPLAHRKI